MVTGELVLHICHFQQKILLAPYNSDGWMSTLMTRYFFNHAPSLQSPGLEASTLEQVTTCSNLSDANPSNKMQWAIWREKHLYFNTVTRDSGNKDFFSFDC